MECRKGHEKIELAGLTRFEIDYGVIPPREISDVTNDSGRYRPRDVARSDRLRLSGNHPFLALQTSC
jgi:hypothetical protein